MSSTNLPLLALLVGLKTHDDQMEHKRRGGEQGGHASLITVNAITPRTHGLQIAINAKQTRSNVPCESEETNNANKQKRMNRPALFFFIAPLALRLRKQHKQ